MPVALISTLRSSLFLPGGKRVYSLKAKSPNSGHNNNHHHHDPHHNESWSPSSQKLIHWGQRLRGSTTMVSIIMIMIMIIFLIVIIVIINLKEVDSMGAKSLGITNNGWKKPLGCRSSLLGTINHHHHPCHHHPSPQPFSFSDHDVSPYYPIL